MNVSGDVTLEVSDLYISRVSSQSQISMELAKSFMLAGLNNSFLFSNTPGMDKHNLDQACSAMVANWNVGHGIELFLKTVLNAVGEKTGPSHNIKTLYYRLESKEYKLLRNFKATSEVLEIPDAVLRRKNILEILQKNYNSLRYFATGNNLNATLADRRSLLLICLVLTGTFCPEQYRSLMKKLSA